MIKITGRNILSTTHMGLVLIGCFNWHLQYFWDFQGKAKGNLETNP